MKKVLLVLMMLFSIAGQTAPIDSVSTGIAIEASKINEIISKVNLLVQENEILKQKIVPVGSVVTMAGSCPSGYRLADGASLLRNDFPDLFSAIGTSHGAINSSSFNLPDYRGLFLRGVDGSAGNDIDKAARTAMNAGGASGNNVGSIQQDINKQHDHTMNTTAYNVNAVIGGIYFRNTNYISAGMDTAVGSIAYYTTNGNAMNDSGGSESRPKNAYVNFCIKVN